MDYKQTYELWLNSPALSAEEKAELSAIAGDEKEIESRFFSQLEFGTAGLRGTMGVGLYRMNIHVIRHATQAFAKVILNEGPEAVKKGVAVCFDCRNNSDVFAREAACIMAAAGIPVRLFESLRPTPELSFAIREYGCIAGINITASHNPKEYNGYKAYWTDGSQVTSPHDVNIIAEVEKITENSQVLTGRNPENIHILDESFDEKYLDAIHELSLSPESIARHRDMKIVYTPLHGAGVRLVPASLRKWGFENIISVPEQTVLDGNFPTVASPNPENPEGFYLAVEIAKKEGADFILGSDPDADRVGLMVNTGNGEFKVLTGNQTGVLLLDYLIGAKQRTGKMPVNPVALKTIVTTEMARKVAEVNGLQCFDTFTGFKFLAQKKDQLEGSGEGNVIMSYEESYGYMLGSYVRDKDAVTAAVAMTEMAAYYAGQGMTLYDALLALYEKYGFYAERTMNLVMPGLDGLKKMAELMAGLRAEPPVEIAGVAVKEQKDYKDGSVVCVESGEKSQMELSGSNVLRYEMADGTSLIVRPSGTEPKVKVYILANGTTREECDAKVEQYAAWAESLKG